ncbi:MAG: ribbon-helix-helix protein, CopG family [Gemmatimonadetes bacterium]|nr:ribbon-helix-helix protein, CopG family [Gemmatimonadota bacterium]
MPAELAKRLTARAKASGVKRSQVVREALQAWLDAAPASETVSETVLERASTQRSAPVVGVRERIGSYIGAVSLDRASAERDALAKRLRAHNWRE